MKNILLITLLLSSSLFGVPAFHAQREFKQSDNSSFKAYLKGDEWFSWIETKTGHMARYNKSSKNYEYMLLDSSGRLVFSNIKVVQSTIASNIPDGVKKIPTDTLSRLWQEAWENRYNH